MGGSTGRKNVGGSSQAYSGFVQEGRPGRDISKTAGPGPGEGRCGNSFWGVAGKKKESSKTLGGLPEPEGQGCSFRGS